MKNIKRAKLLSLVCILAAALIFLGISIVQAQVNIQGKPDTPPGKDKPPKNGCNNNGICEHDEYDSSLPFDSQTCSDCNLDLASPLIIDSLNLQIAAAASMPNRVFQFKYIATLDKYQETWASGIIEGSIYRSVSQGDIDNDGFQEIVAVESYVSRRETSGKGNKKVTTIYYNPRILIYENGCPGLGELSWFPIYLGESTGRVYDTIIADVDNDGSPVNPDNELVILRGEHIEIYDLSEDGFNPVMMGEDYPSHIFTIDVGDADNDGDNEIVLSIFDVGAPIILDYDPITKTWDPKTAEPIPVEYYGSRMDFLGLDYAKVRDCDNVEDDAGVLDNEIVGSGNNGRFMIWKYNPGSSEYEYELRFVSGYLGGFTEGIDVGDLNGDALNEVIVGVSFGSLYVFSYSPETGDYYENNSVSISSGIMGLETRDLDNDGRDEIALSAGGLNIFDFIGTNLETGFLEQTYFSIFCSTLEIR
jgi:hypothetical protein